MAQLDISLDIMMIMSLDHYVNLSPMIGCVNYFDNVKKCLLMLVITKY